MTDLELAQAIPCPRGPEECTGLAEPEEDSGSRYWVCQNPECGFTFGHQLIPQEDSGACTQGVPAHLQDRRAPVFVEFGRKP